MFTIFSTLLSLGQITRGDAVVMSMSKKAESEIAAGDFVKLVESSTGSDPKQVEVEKATANTDCIYGVASLGIQGNIVPIVTKGHIIANVDSTVFSDAAVGKCICKNADSPCSIILVQKLNAIKADGSKEESKAYEVKL